MAVGLTDNPSDLRRWMVAGLEVAALIEDFEGAYHLVGRRDEVLHHDQTASMQNAFRKDVCLLVNIMEELGNPFQRRVKTYLSLTTQRLRIHQQSRLLRRHRRLANNSSKYSQRNFLWKEQRPLMTQYTAIG